MASVSETAPYLIPEPDGMFGPVTRSKIRRSLIVYGVFFVCGMLPVLAGAPGPWRALGLGLVFPGGGLLFTESFALFVAVVFVFLFSIFIWFATGNIVLPPLIWAGAAIYAGAYTQHGLWEFIWGAMPLSWEAWTGAICSPPVGWVWAQLIVPVLAIGTLGGTYGIMRSGYRSALERRETRNAYLRDGEHHGIVELQQRRRADRSPELSPDAVALSRYLLDRALQPIDEFNGFDKVDQFQTSAMRYQLCELGYSLSILQHNYLPAFRGYLGKAHRCVIAKMQDKINWSYWRLENLWGNLNTDPDPIVRDNIMLSGWYAMCIGSYMSNNLDYRYTEPASITFELNEHRAFEYDFHSIAEVLRKNFGASDFCLFPCEPNWIYVMCNNYGALALILHDRMFRTDHWRSIEAVFREHLEQEFIQADGRVTAIRSSRLGLTLPGLTTTMADAFAAYYMHPVFPDIAERSWRIVEHDLARIAADGSLEIELRGWDKIDTGNYRFTDATTVAQLAASAREMGNEDLCRKLLEKAYADYGPDRRDGVLSFENASNYANIALARAHFSLPGGFHDLVRDGPSQDTLAGPHLADANYPDVLLAAAHTNGRDLNLVAYPGGTATRADLQIRNLRPAGHYDLLVNGSIVADAPPDDMGIVNVMVDLHGRTEIVISARD